MTQTTISSLAKKIALRLKDDYSIGFVSSFCDEPADFDSVDLDELAETIQEVIDAE